MTADVAKAAGLLFVAAVAQVTIFAPIDVLGGTPDLLLVTLVALALLRGAVFGAAAGFFAGLVVDTATLGTLGMTSLLLTLAGYWAGRYAETTGRDREHAPLLAIASMSLLYAACELALHVLVGDSVSAGVFLRSLLPTTILALLLMPPLYALCSRLLPASERSVRRGREVELFG